MICMLDMFKNCLILRHRRSHDITVPASTKNVFSLTRSSSTTSIISCTKKQDDLPPLSTLPRIPNHSEQHRNSSYISSSALKSHADLPVRPNSIAGLPSIIEVPQSEQTEVTGNAVTIIEVNRNKSEEPPYSEPIHPAKPEVPAHGLSSRSRIEDDILNEKEEYPYQDIYEEIRHRDSREDDLPDVVTSAYASGEQVYQELLDLVKEEEIKEEKRRSQLLCAENSDESVGTTSERSDDGSDCSEDKKNSLEDLYAVPKRNKTNGPRLPPRRVQSNYSRDPDWVPEVPEKSILLRRSISDVCNADERFPDDLCMHDGLAVIMDDEKSHNAIYEKLHERRDRLI